MCLIEQAKFLKYVTLLFTKFKKDNLQASCTGAELYSENKRLAVCKERFADFIGEKTELCLKFWTILCELQFAGQAGDRA